MCEVPFTVIKLSVMVTVRPPNAETAHAPLVVRGVDDTPVGKDVRVSRHIALDFNRKSWIDKLDIPLMSEMCCDCPSRHAGDGWHTLYVEIGS